MSDSILERNIKAVATQFNIPEATVRELWEAQSKTVKDFVSKLENGGYDKVKIPIIGSLEFNQKHYDTVKQKQAIKMESQNQS